MSHRKMSQQCGINAARQNVPTIIHPTLMYNAKNNNLLTDLSLKARKCD